MLATCVRKPKVPGSIPVASYIQRWTLCSNSLPMTRCLWAGGSGREELKKASPFPCCPVNRSWKKTQIEKEIVKHHYVASGIFWNFEFLNPAESSSVSITSSILCLYHFLFTSLLHFLYSSNLFSVSSILSLVVILFLYQLPTLRNYMGHCLPSFFSPHIQHIPSTSLY